MSPAICGIVFRAAGPSTVFSQSPSPDPVVGAGNLGLNHHVGIVSVNPKKVNWRIERGIEERDRRRFRQCCGPELRGDGHDRPTIRERASRRLPIRSLMVGSLYQCYQDLKIHLYVTVINSQPASIQLRSVCAGPGPSLAARPLALCNPVHHWHQNRLDTCPFGQRLKRRGAQHRSLRRPPRSDGQNHRGVGECFFCQTFREPLVQGLRLTRSSAIRTLLHDN